MSPYTISLIVFYIAVGLVFLFDFGHVAQVIAGIAALICAALLLVNAPSARA